MDVRSGWMRRARCALALTPILLAGSTAVARADYPVECVGPGNAAKIVCTFTSPCTHGLTLPPGVTSVDADAYGAAGGDGIYDFTVFGGLGGRATATLSVPASVLQVVVGGQGTSTAGGRERGRRAGHSRLVRWRWRL
jgi:hypothetical protein